MPARSFTGPMSAVAEAGMAPSYNVRDTIPVLEKTESSHNTGTWLYASDVSRVWVFCGVRRRWSAAFRLGKKTSARGMPKPIP
ncbi:hypothetical protein [Bacteroides sp.]|uniref:hypothetical protein n=1 Tax=Bacteroides sp. TaxID=29523 RepID=UPI00291346D1|nr:hypothetical protein [Bacteroides sp.]MDU7617144.1 hypothetical protein [Bacteroides sp.]